jgi:hypothetical protein
LFLRSSPYYKAPSQRGAGGVDDLGKGLKHKPRYGWKGDFDLQTLIETSDRDFPIDRPAAMPEVDVALRRQS